MSYNKGAVLAVLVVCGYVGLEGYAIHQISHKTKPDFIYDTLIQAKTITEACNSDRLEYRNRFEKTLLRVENNYGVMLADADPEATDADIRQQIAAATLMSVATAENKLSSTDCDHQMMKNHFQRYRLYARKSR